MLSHDNYLEQYRTLGQFYPLRTGHRYFSILPTNHAIDFMWASSGRSCAAPRWCTSARCAPRFMPHDAALRHHAHGGRAAPARSVRASASASKLEERSAWPSTCSRGCGRPTPRSRAGAAPGPQRGACCAGARGVRGQARDALLRRRVRGRDARAVLLRPRHPGGDRLRAHRGRHRADRQRPQAVPRRLGGPPLDGVTLEIRNGPHPETGVGEVWAKSRTVMLGYLDEPELTAETIVDGWLRTGDLGYLDASGHLHLVGRRKNMIVTAGGKNVYPEDVESVFAGLACEELAVFACRTSSGCRARCAGSGRSPARPRSSSSAARWRRSWQRPRPVRVSSAASDGRASPVRRAHLEHVAVRWEGELAGQPRPRPIRRVAGQQRRLRRVRRRQRLEPRPHVDRAAATQQRAQAPGRESDARRAAAPAAACRRGSSAPSRARSRPGAGAPTGSSGSPPLPPAPALPWPRGHACLATFGRNRYHRFRPCVGSRVGSRGRRRRPRHPTAMSREASRMGERSELHSAPSSLRGAPRPGNTLRAREDLS
jgi:hypothetical protein